MPTKAQEVTKVWVPFYENSRGWLRNTTKLVFLECELVGLRPAYKKIPGSKYERMSTQYLIRHPDGRILVTDNVFYRNNEAEITSLVKVVSSVSSL